jgi:DNA-binding transcriptional LysR family regulator
MHIKWLEDFITLAETRSFSRAAELRHVTHPAFGRRIRALEAWAGTPLVERGGSPVRLTPAGETFLEASGQMVRSLGDARGEMHSAANRQAQTIRLATGRTLARMLVADWLVRLQPVLQSAELHVMTRSLADVTRLLEQDEADFALLYHHTALALRLDARRFSHVTVATDRLVPVSRANAQGEALYSFAAPGPTPYLAYASSLALGRLVDDHLAHNPRAPQLQRRVECDSADAHYEYVVKGVGVAWLPWSMVHRDCSAGLLAPAGDKAMEVKFDVRLYRPKRRMGSLAETVWRALSH